MQFAMEERTFTIIKPNAVAMGVTGRIIDAFLQDGFRILAMRLVCMSRNDAEKFYAIQTTITLTVSSTTRRRRYRQ